MSLSRQEANLEILERLLEAVEAGPDQRFGQLLWSVGVLEAGEGEGVRDPYQDESTAILKRMKRRVQWLQQQET
ncbi:hypothetical protein [Deinococcus aquaedulcis]|uniref:hypothetical protein n=1 Tax=Deinococcus aquaedulcis TaxID=2840455 RepID=UPI001C832413|nr:hypothetical protein [Deinococcus aquaedulcis]